MGSLILFLMVKDKMFLASGIKTLKNKIRL